MFALVAEIGIVGVQVGFGAVQKTVGVDLREPCVHAHIAWQYNMCAEHLAEGVVHTAVERQINVTALVLTCEHVQACTERRHTVSGCTYTSLYIHRTDGRCHVSHVHPEHCLTLCIVQRHVVHCHVDARMICAADAEVRVSYAQSIVRGY